MNYHKTVSSFKSTDRIHNIAYYIYEPTTNQPIKGILQISHGMCEYIQRYEEFIGFVTSQGFLVCGNDHLGHGGSVESKDDLGYFAKENGWECLTNDLKQLTHLMKKQYPSLPYFMLGHSMGSFLLRAYLIKYGDQLTGAIISGTGGKNPIAKIGELLISKIAIKKGDHYRSKKFNKIIFGGYNKRFPNNLSGFSWLTRDPVIVERYSNDPNCNFIFTANGFKNLIKVQRVTTKKSWANKVPKQLPIFLLSGDMDPVGNYGKGVKETYHNLLGANVVDVSIKLYKDGRHEMLNETNRKEVFEDIVRWMTAGIKQ